MDKQPASLIDQQHSVLQPATGALGINQYEIRPGQPYLSGAHTLSANNGPFGVPYWMSGLAVQTCNNQIITAPVPQKKSIITHQAKQIYSAGQYVVGQAPTSGVFTGVEDHCA